jgi:hypothetical protein
MIRFYELARWSFRRPFIEVGEPYHSPYAKEKSNFVNSSSCTIYTVD